MSGVKFVGLGIAISLFSVILDWILSIMDLVYHLFFSMLSFSPTSYLTFLGEGINMVYQNLFLPLAMSVLFVLAMMSLFRCFFSVKGEEEPAAVILRLAILLFVIAFNPTIIHFFYSFFEQGVKLAMAAVNLVESETPFTGLTAYVRDVLNEIVPEAAPEVSSILTDLDILGVTINNPVITFLVVLLLLYYIKVFFSLVLTTFVRYVINTVLIVMAPIFWALGVTKRTENITKGFVRMLFSNMLSVIVGLFGCWMYLYVISHASIEGGEELLLHNEALRSQALNGNTGLSDTAVIHAVGLIINFLIVGAIGVIFPKIESYMNSLGMAAVVPGEVKSGMKGNAMMLMGAFGLSKTIGDSVSGIGSGILSQLSASRFFSGKGGGETTPSGTPGGGSEGGMQKAAEQVLDVGGDVVKTKVIADAAKAMAEHTGQAVGGAASPLLPGSANAAGLSGEVGALSAAGSSTGIFGAVTGAASSAVLAATVAGAAYTAESEKAKSGLGTSEYRNLKEDAERLMDGAMYEGDPAKEAFQRLTDKSAGTLDFGSSMSHDASMIEGVQDSNQYHPGLGEAEGDLSDAMIAAERAGLEYDPDFESMPYSETPEPFVPDGSQPFEAVKMGNGRVEGLYQDRFGNTQGFVGELVSPKQYQEDPKGVYQLANGDYMRFTSAKEGSPLASLAQQNHYDADLGKFVSGKKGNAMVGEDGRIH